MRNTARSGAITCVQSLNVEEAQARAAWVAKALCRNIDPEELFVRGAAQREAAAICRNCPVILECAADALDNRVEYGIWGGLTERQRRALLKRHPEVQSWAAFINARRNHRSAVPDNGAASA
ncbi:WhiB family transcriptional regulator [Mycobacterium attenuatum]|uniref:WhiB family transcriptional regulator n=1 Tax=Mycobacterium attenuatum TaxID=2341086 RepID=UPI002452F989|nr:WhiB family transcriptional regulator [Mycobacterium attenuatum]